jgi:hypothetical protein
MPPSSPLGPPPLFNNAPQPSAIDPDLLQEPQSVPVTDANLPLDSLLAVAVCLSFIFQYICPNLNVSPSSLV